jgi:hypothetical protein
LQRNGVLNTLLHDVGLGALAVDWLGSAHWVVPSIGAVVIWQQLGFGVVVFTAALLALPSEVTEAALLDGATPCRTRTGDPFLTIQPFPAICGIDQFCPVPICRAFRTRRTCGSELCDPKAAQKASPRQAPRAHRRRGGSQRTRRER